MPLCQCLGLNYPLTIQSATDGTHGVFEPSTARKAEGAFILFPQEVMDLATYLREEKPSLSEIAIYLCNSTFARLSASSIFIAAVRSNGAIFYPAGYGFDKDLFSNVPERSVETDSPVANMLRTQTVVSGGSWDEYPFADRNNAFKVFPNGFKSSFSFPLFGFGGAVVNCAQPNELTDELKDFFHCIGLVAGLYCAVSPISEVLEAPLPKNQPEQLLTLTPRQWQVLEYMQKGATNISIARTLGFSESTIRHETMRIYRKLNLRGRIDLPAKEQTQ